MLKLSNLNVQNWRQYQTIDITFHERLTVITGANGSGKTTLINLIGQLIGWASIFTATPLGNSRGQLSYNSGLWKTNSNNLTGYNPIGRIVFSNGQVCDLSIHDTSSAQYGVNYHWPMGQPNLRGVYIQSHRPVYRYVQVSAIPTAIRDKSSAYADYFSPIYNIYNNNYPGKTPLLSLKESLISMAALGYGNQVIVPNQEAIENFERFQKILRALLPESIGFERIEIRMPEVVLITKSGDFSIDSVSGGIASIIDIAWRIFTYGNENESMIVTIDEPENHLHPELQRVILTGLLKAFPQCQFIVATHSPFIISSSPDAFIYALDFNSINKVYAERLDLANKLASSSQILRDVLGLESTLPIWVEDKIEEISQRFSSETVSIESLENLRNELNQEGMGQLADQVIVKVLEDFTDDKA